MVAETANTVPSNTIIEVRCGLGEIIYRINTPKKFGVDNNRNVIKAASFHHGSKLEFRVGSLDAVLQTAGDTNNTDPISWDSMRYVALASHFQVTRTMSAHPPILERRRI